MFYVLTWANVPLTVLCAVLCALLSPALATVLSLLALLALLALKYKYGRRRRLSRRLAAS
jgi:hypothetical protein